MIRILIEDADTLLSHGLAKRLSAAGFDAACAAAIMQAIREQSPDAAIVFSVSELVPVQDTALIAVFRRRNTYLEGCLRRQGIHCIQLIDTIDIVPIVRQILNMKNTPPAD